MSLKLYVPEVVTTVPVAMHQFSPGIHSAFNSGNTSIGAPTIAMRNSATARLIKIRFEGVRILELKRFRKILSVIRISNALKNYVDIRLYWKLLFTYSTLK